MKLSDLKVQSYLLDFSDGGGVCVTLERAQRPDGPDRWAIREKGFCLNKQGEWEYEPMPSSRTDGFFKRCRWASAEKALAFWAASGAKSRFRGYLDGLSIAQDSTSEPPKGP